MSATEPQPGQFPAAPSVELQGKTRIFLSYSRQDKAMADWLRAGLEAAGFEVFRDVDSTLPGEEWWQRLTGLIALSDAIVFLLSTRSSASKVCSDEVEYSRSLHKRIFPAVIEAVDWKEVPEGLAKIHSVFLSDPSQREAAVTQLAAAVETNIGWVREHTRLFDRARQWESKERSRSELLAGQALEEAERWLTEQPSSAEAPTKLHHDYIKASRDADRAVQEERLRESEEQRRILQEQRDRAERSFRAGLDVISETQQRVITDLNNTRGVSLPTREAIIRTMLDATETLKKVDPDFYPSSVQQQFAGNEMYAKTSLAQVHIDKGEFDKAEEVAKEAIELSEKFRLDDYNPLQRRPGLRQTAFLLASLGEIKLRQRKFDEAIGYLQQSVSARERGVEYYSQYSDAADFRMDLADGLQRLSIAYLESGAQVKALEPAERAFTLMETLAAAQPENKSYRVNLATMGNSAGDALFENGRIPEALDRFQSAYTIFDELLREYPDNLYLLRGKSICMERLGNTKMSQRDFAGAVRVFEDTLALKQQIGDADPANAQSAEDFQLISRKLGQAKEAAASAGKR